MDALHSRHRAIELQCQLIIPCQIVLLTRFDLHLFSFLYEGRAFVDHKLHLLSVLGFLRDNLIHHQSASFGTNGGVGILLTTKDYLDAIVAIGHFHGEIERFCRFLFIGSRQDIVAVTLVFIIYRL